MRAVVMSLVCLITCAGCVTKGTHLKAVTELDEARKSAEADRTQLRTQLDALTRELTETIERLQQDKTRLSNELLTAQSGLAQATAGLSAAERSLAEERLRRQQLEGQVRTLEAELHQAQELGGELRRERDLFTNKTQDLQRRLETGQQELASRQKQLTEAEARIATLEHDKEEVTQRLTVATAQSRELEGRLAAEAARIGTLEAEKQRLMGGTSSAQEEIALLQKKAGALESEAARAAVLAVQLTERDQELGQLRQQTADRETLLAKLSSSTEELQQTRRRVEQLTSELAALSDESARTKQERDTLAAQARKYHEALRLAEEALEKIRRDEQELAARLHQEQSSKEAEIQRLTQAQAALTRSLQEEIDKGDVTIQQVRDRLTINMVDRVLFDSGQGEVKPSARKVLKQVSEILKSIHDKQIRIEGHTDNVPIGTKLRDKFASNWELSTARATSVVRHLIEDGGVDRLALSAVGYADTRPVADNDSDTGRAANRRIEIVLYPKDLHEIASQLSR